MANVPLKLSNLRHLDYGKVEAAFQQELERCVKDCVDRPHDSKRRNVAVIFTITPTDDQDPHCDGVDVIAQIHSSIPKRQSRPYSMRTHQNGSLSFHPDVADDPNAHTIIDEIEEQQNKPNGE